MSNTPVRSRRQRARVSPTMPLCTCGHSTRPVEELTHLLLSHGVTLLADVRAIPRSRFYPQYNRGFLERNLLMPYRWMGDRLGGKNVKAIPPEEFAAGIAELTELSKRETVCIMCSEREPTPTSWRKEVCHRWSALTPALRAAGAEVVHI